MKLFLVLLIIPFNLWAQPFLNGKDITGTWQGFINTTEKKIPYELTISRKDGRLVAFSLTSFIVNNQEIISVKKVILKFKDSEIIAEDDDVIFDNLANEAAKKIKQTNRLRLNDEGERWKLTGTFETKTQRVLRPASGEVYLEKAANPTETKLMAKLAEMKLTDGLTFTPVRVSAEIAPPPVPAPAPPQVTEAVTSTPEPEISLPALVYKEQPRLELPNKNNWVATVSKPVKTRIFIAPVPPITRPAPAVASVPVRTSTPAAVPVKVPATPAQPVAVKKPVIANMAVAPALDLASRKIETIGQVFIEADSLMLTLYDNGEVDGDSVSLVLNGTTIVSKQGLSTSAFTKTIYITPDMGDSIQLLMYAENLGTLPPNTGLLILHFDNKRQEIRFSGDLNKNAAITLRRRQRN